MNKYPQEAYAGAAITQSLQRESIRTRLQANISFHENAAKKNREALELLDKNPEFEKLHDLLAGL